MSVGIRKQLGMGVTCQRPFIGWGLRVHLKCQKTREGGWRRAKEARKKRPKTGKKQMKVIENK